MEKGNSENLQNFTFLINPTRHPSSVKILKKILKRRRAAEVIDTRSRDELIEEVVKFCKSSGHGNLVIWGGDGTVHNAINAMMVHPPKHKALGFLRGGTGNGIQDSYEIPWRIGKQIETYIESAEHKYYEAVDLLKIETEQETLYGQLFGVGVDVDVLQVRKEKFSSADKLIIPGIKYYVSAGLKVLKSFDFKNLPESKLAFKNGKYALRGGKINAEFPFKTLLRETKSPLIEIGTRPYYGKRFKICPDVVCNDGKMDAYLFQFTNHFTVLRSLFSVWNGWHDRINNHLVKAGYPLIERYEVESTVLEMGEPFYFHVDGELYHSGPAARVKVTILPRVVNFLVPENFYRKFHPFFIDAIHDLEK